MSWEIIVLIALGVLVLISVPVIFIMWKISKRALGVFDDVREDIHVMDRSFKKDPFESLDAKVKRMTGPGPKPF